MGKRPPAEQHGQSWEILAGALRDSTFACFPGAGIPKPDFEEDRHTRLQLLRDRGNHRQELGAPDHDLEQIQLQLTLVSRRLKKVAREIRDQEDQKWLEELWEAWKVRNFSMVHRLRVKIQRNGRGPKNRFFWAPRLHMAEAADWEKHLAHIGTAGGMAAKTMSP